MKGPRLPGNTANHLSRQDQIDLVLLIDKLGVQVDRIELVTPTGLYTVGLMDPSIESVWVPINPDFEDYRPHSTHPAMITRLSSGLDVEVLQTRLSAVALKVHALPRATVGELHPGARRPKHSRRQPPDTAHFLLRLLLPRRDRDAVIGDLFEEFEEDVLPEFGVRRARFWFWWQAIGSIIAIRRHAIVVRLVALGTLEWLRRTR